MAKLSPQQIAANLKLPGWEYKNNALVKRFQFESFMKALDFINHVGEVAEAADHHPDIYVNYSRVTFSCSTHSEGGVTEKDLSLAENIENLYGREGSWKPAT
jgi:4a-hydroxytetrahydrobiopterin dehydratase